MKEKPNYAELEKRIDFTALAGKLGQLTEADNPQPKTVFTLLDKVREQIVAARRNRNVSYQVLAKELTSAGIPVSEPTLRKYIRAQGGEKKPRHKAAPKTGNGDGKPAAPVANAETKPATPTRTHRFNLNV
jgi:ribosome-binding protein aMBF1 (putative translation factor)